MGAAHLVCFISLCIVIHVVVGTLLTVEGPFYVSSNSNYDMYNLSNL
jgi:hypothetical protein